jgi:hypothetical protein
MPFAGTSIGRAGVWPFVVAITRTGSRSRPAKLLRISAHSGSWAVLEATRTSGSSPAGSSTSGWGSSNSSGPVITASAGQSRGYSNCGNVPAIASRSLIPPWKRSCGGRPTRARVSFSSRRPTRRPVSSAGSAARQPARPIAVRGGAIPVPKNGIPGSWTG